MTDTKKAGVGAGIHLGTRGTRGIQCGIASAAVLAWAATMPLFAASLPSGFTESGITGIISYATSMQFAPDGKLFVLEQTGTMKVYQGSGAAMWTQVAPSSNFFTGSPLSVDSSGERGLLGLAFDPNYLSNRFLYVYYTTSSSPVHNRISRFTANAAGTQVVAGSQAVLMDLDNLSSATNHNGGALHFGPDGKLYVSVGDNANPSNAQSITTRLGKMLRLNPNPSSPIPTDNPSSIAGIPGTTSGLNKAIWAAGLRNPFTFAFKPGTSLMYINDVGQSTYEEVNVGATGANYGWSSTEGTFNQGSFPNYTNPIIAYPQNASDPNYPAGLSYTGHATISGAFYVPATMTFPSSYLGDYFFGDHVDDWIRRYDSASNSVQNFATGAAALVSLRVGSDGALYYLARDSSGSGQGRVFRVQYPFCPADIAVNGQVNIDDLLAVINAWGPCGNPNNCPADIAPAGGNDVVNIDDLLVVINNWGSCP